MWKSRSPGVDGAWWLPPVDLDERMQLGRPRPGEQPVPRVGADRGHHREAFGRVAETDRAHQPGDVARARRERFARRRRRWSPPERWRRASAAQEPVAAGLRAPSDPKSRSWAKDGEPCRQVHRGCASSSTRRRRRSTSARRSHSGCGDAGFTELSERDAWPTKGRSSSCGPARWSPGTATANRRRRSASSAATPTAPTCGSSSIPTASYPAGRSSHWQPYGGAWLNSWLDRDLGISGRLSVRVGRTRRAPTGPDRRADPAGAAAGHPPGRGPQVGVAGPAAARQRDLGRRRRTAVIPRLRGRAGRGRRRGRAGHRPDDPRPHPVDAGRGRR